MGPKRLVRRHGLHDGVSWWSRGRRVEWTRRVRHRSVEADLNACSLGVSRQQTALTREHGGRGSDGLATGGARVAGGTGPGGCLDDRRGARRRLPRRSSVASRPGSVPGRRRARNRSSHRRALDPPERQRQGRSVPTRSHRPSVRPAADPPPRPPSRSHNTHPRQRGPGQATAPGQVRLHER